jgi:O-antigen/teichoic acid export membrane protein
VTRAAGRRESAAVHGARWVTVAFVIVGLLNYGYALLLTHLLSVAAYARFSAGQGLILWASTVAIVSVPWVLAQALARAQSAAERNAAVRFAKFVSLAGGTAAAIVVAAIALRLVGLSGALALALSIFVVFLGTTTTGWLQGRERMRGLSLLYVLENLLKNSAGVVLVVVCRLGDTGALAAFGIGGLAMLACWPRTPREPGRLWRTVVADGTLWRRAARIAGAQGVVSLFVAVDVVLVAMLPGPRALVASYQASATLARVPLFVASAVATAFFPSLSRGAVRSARLAAQALRLYGAVSLPIAAVLMTIPARLLALVFPAQYGAVAGLLRYTAVIGLCAGAISLITAFFQAADDYRCLKYLGAGLAAYVAGLLTGWQLAGVTGLAAGGALGALLALILLTWRLVAQQGLEVLGRVPLLEPLVLAAVLAVARADLFLWLAAAALVAYRAGVRFLRPGPQHAAGPRWATAKRVVTR